VENNDNVDDDDDDNDVYLHKNCNVLVVENQSSVRIKCGRDGGY
jgi:hypothetical protein